MQRLTKESNDLVRNRAISILRGLSKENLLSHDELSIIDSFLLIERTENTKLKEYEDLEEQGLLLKLPCKVGDEFLIVAYRDKKIVHVKCTGYTIQCDVINKINHAYVWLDSVEKESDYWKVPFEEFNNQCFLTKDEVEKALAEMEK